MKLCETLREEGKKLRIERRRKQKEMEGLLKGSEYLRFVDHTVGY